MNYQLHGSYTNNVETYYRAIPWNYYNLPTNMFYIPNSIPKILLTLPQNILNQQNNAQDVSNCPLFQDNCRKKRSQITETSKNIEETTQKKTNFESKKVVELTKAIKRDRNLRYRSKNTESNIINRLLSLFEQNQKKQPILTRFFGKSNQKRKSFEIYLRYFMSLARPAKRYLFIWMTRTEADCWNSQKLRQIAEKSLSMSPKQFTSYTRKILRFYLKEGISVSILTSRRIKKQYCKEHLQKIRQLQDYLFRQDINC